MDTRSAPADTLRRGSGVALAISVLIVAGAGTASAEVSLGGFVEGAWGVRTAESQTHPEGPDYTLHEVRAQLQLEAWGDVGEAFVRFDVLHDQAVTPVSEVDMREGWAKFVTLRDKLEIKAGRQTLTWGTGDLLFVNDRFPRDWESFFIGRELQYLRFPSDVIRLGLFGLPMDVDFVITPLFTPDALPAPGPRFSILQPDSVAAPEKPKMTVENAELALRLSRWVGSSTIELYGYWGFMKSPDGITDPTAEVLQPYYPAENVYGASWRGEAFSFLYWIEGGYFDSREYIAPDDRQPTDPLVPPSSVQWILGTERQFFTDLTAGLQWNGVRQVDEPKDTDNLFALRLDQRLNYQTVLLSLFTYYSSTDKDAYLRPVISWKATDQVELTLGANVFEGEKDNTRFGAFDQDDNVYVRMRWTY